MKQTISHELPNEFCPNMCHTDAFIEFLLWRHKAGETQGILHISCLLLVSSQQDSQMTDTLHSSDSISGTIKQIDNIPMIA